MVLVIMTIVMIQISSLSAFAQRTKDSKGGYIDWAVVRNQARFRFDAAYDNPVPDRAEFFYPQIGVGPGKAESRVDFQETEAYLETLLSPNLSAFAEVPVRFLNPTENANTAGLSDIRGGFKCALINNEDQLLTFQLRTYFPTGDGDRGLGTNHYSLEPGLLYQRNYDRSSTFGEFKAFIPIDPSTKLLQDPNNNNNNVSVNFGGPVLRYGVGYSYDLFQQQIIYHCPDCGEYQQYISSRLSFVNEFVGWTVLDGLKSDFIDNRGPTGNATTNSAAGDTIVNVKVGLRASLPLGNVYVGYGRALTGDVWYRDLLRMQYSFAF
jgi:hypothetical protein